MERDPKTGKFCKAKQSDDRAADVIADENPEAMPTVNADEDEDLSLLNQEEYYDEEASDGAMVLCMISVMMGGGLLVIYGIYQLIKNLINLF